MTKVANEIETWVIVVASGSGQRFGGPKQFAAFGAQRVVDVAIDTAQTVSNGVVLVVPDGHRETRSDIEVAIGGATRTDSVRAGLALVPRSADFVLIHDAARPNASTTLFSRVIDSLVLGSDAVIPVCGVVDSLRSTNGDVVDRDTIVAVQTPQGFTQRSIRDAYEHGGDATDDATLVSRRGGRVVTIEGDRSNMKITDPVDLTVAMALSGQQNHSTFAPQDVASNANATDTEHTMNMTNIRIGNGFDIHRVSNDESRTLVLGGVTFPGELGLVGHSDADVVTHVCCEAVLGAAGLGDIGSVFPDTNEAFKDANSLDLFREVVRMLSENKWVIGNIDVSIICERPKIAPVRHEMQETLSKIAGAPITIAGRRPEKIGAIGRGEGVAAMASALIYVNEGH